MKYVLIFGLMILALPAMAAGPSTTCPSGYVTIEDKYITLADSACPSGSYRVADVTSCLISSPSGYCYMFAPTDITYSDTKGAYRYSQICPLT